MEVTSWSARFYERLNSFGIDTGLHLRRVGGVSEFKIMLGSASARVQESPRQYYEVWIDVQALTRPSGHESNAGLQRIQNILRKYLTVSCLRTSMSSSRVWAYLCFQPGERT